jgi:predicted nucleotidyltransferase
MLKLCRVNIKRSEEIFEKIKRYTKRVIETLNPYCIILFGSFATEDINEGSDVDMIIIADFKEPFLERIKILLDLNDGINLPLEPIGYTPEEFQKMRDEGNSFIEEVLLTGKILYGKIS